MVSSRCPPKLVGCKMVDSYLFWWGSEVRFFCEQSVLVLVLVLSVWFGFGFGFGLEWDWLSSAWIVCPLRLCGFSSGFWIGIAAWRCFDGLFRAEDFSSLYISRRCLVMAFRIQLASWAGWEVGTGESAKENSKDESLIWLQCNTY